MKEEEEEEEGGNEVTDHAVSSSRRGKRAVGESKGGCTAACRFSHTNRSRTSACICETLMGRFQERKEKAHTHTHKEREERKRFFCQRGCVCLSVCVGVREGERE